MLDMCMSKMNLHLPKDIKRCACNSMQRGKTDATVPDNDECDDLTIQQGYDHR